MWVRITDVQHEHEEYKEIKETIEEDAIEIGESEEMDGNEEMVDTAEESPQVTMKPKKEKVKKGRPPQEIIEFMRKKRSFMKDLKDLQRKQRHDLVAELDNLERLAIEQNFGYSASLWVDKACPLYPFYDADE